MKKDQTNDKPQSDPPSKIPDFLLKQLNEHSGGTFFLFTVDSKGNPACHIQSDNATMQQGLVEQMRAAITALERARDMENQLWQQSILSEMGIEETVMFDINDINDIDLDDMD